jgi:phosphoglycolate phosphatase-like HAD superfamily hydrolase
MPMRLLLFDIDGTLLLRATREHRAALHAAIADVHGIEVADETVTYAGRTDLEIARAILTRAGVAATAVDDGQAAVREAACDHYARLAPESLRDRVAPGVPELLHALDGRVDVRLSLLTGNLEPIARLKLRRAGLLEHFPAGQGAYGSDGEDRAALPAIARARAGSSERPFPHAETVVIGDTPADIACARADGCAVIAVATGPFDADELAAADAVADDAHGLLALLGVDDR